MVLEASERRNRIHYEHVKLIWIGTELVNVQLIGLRIPEHFFHILEEINKLGSEGEST